MKITHFAPFAPNACGLYEAARDMVIADRRSGHEACLIDVGITSKVNNKFEHAPGVIGVPDSRGGTEIITANPEEVYNADIIIVHTGTPDNWIVQTQAPIIWILHGRPLACFRTEQFGSGNSYSLISQIAQWPRVKAMVTFWPFHVQYWNAIIPADKLVCFPAPPIDETRFCEDGNNHDFKELGGYWNIAIAESWREDIDIYEVSHGIIELAKSQSGVKYHIYAMNTPLPQCWDWLIKELRRLNVLGELWARRPNIEEIYRSADILLSPQRIVTRTIGEALSCGLPVVAAQGCEYAPYTMRPDEPETVADALKSAIRDLTNVPEAVHDKVKETAKAFSLTEYSNQMNTLYKKLLDKNT